MMEPTDKDANIETAREMIVGGASREWVIDWLTRQCPDHFATPADADAAIGA